MGYTVKTRAEAMAKAKELTQGYRTFWGTGNPYYEPYAQIVAEPFGYYVTIAPEGDGYGVKQQLYTIWIESQK